MYANTLLKTVSEDDQPRELAFRTLQFCMQHRLQISDLMKDTLPHGYVPELLALDKGLKEKALHNPQGRYLLMELITWQLMYGEQDRGLEMIQTSVALLREMITNEEIFDFTKEEKILRFIEQLSTAHSKKSDDETTKAFGG